jgi:hypothetical protein
VRVIGQALGVSLIGAHSLLFGATNSVEIGGRQWQLRMTSDEADLLRELKARPALTWCFEALGGRGIVTDLSLHLEWKGQAPELSLGKSEVKVSDEDRRILSCLDNTLKEVPPRSLREASDIRFQYTLKRAR